MQSAELWQESGRYDAYGKEMLRIKDRQDRPMLYGPTNEEMITDVFRSYVKSYKDLPLNLYHIQLKFRDEIRPRFGTMRSREFLMKDAYSFDLNREGAEHAYNRMFAAYLRTFSRLGLRAIPMRADTGPIGGNLSHEFIILADTGESEVFCHKEFLGFDIPGEDTNFDDVAGLKAIFDKWTSRYAATSEMHDEAAFNAVPEAERVSARGIEVGHIFYFGTKYSEAMGAKVQGPDGKEHTVHMGSYGIGPTRLVPAIIEASHDDNGIIWPRSVAPFEVVVINMKVGDAACDAASELLYASLSKAGVDVLLRRQGRACRHEVRHRRPDRRAVPGHRRAAIGRRWRGRGEGPQDRRARDADRRGGDCAADGEGLKPGRHAAGDGSGGIMAEATGESTVTKAKAAPASRPFSGFERMVAGRYLRSRRREAFISVIAGFSFIGIMLGVATLIIVMAVMNGFRTELISRILGINGHMIVQPIDGPLDNYAELADRFSKVPGVKLAIPLVEGQTLASGKGGAGTGALVRGIRADDLAKLKTVSDHIKSGDLVGFASGEGLAIGARMAEQLGINAGDTITLVAPEGDVTPLGVNPRVKTYPGLGDLRDRHVGIRRVDHLHAARGSAALLQRRGAGAVDRAVRRQSRRRWTRCASRSRRRPSGRSMSPTGGSATAPSSPHSKSSATSCS